MDKDRAHRLAALAGVQVPQEPVSSGREAAAGRAGRPRQKLGYPLFVKPVRSGSSFGISRVTQPAGLAAAVEEAFGHDREAAAGGGGARF